MTEAERAEADLGPSELDLLEDALEELELDGALERWAEDELDPRVSARLLDYRNVLAAARQALPLEDVPGGVLDDVLAQARQAAATPAAAAAVVSEPWWTRLRRSFMVPALALAGTAALVLWVFDPKDQATLGQSPAPAAEPAPAAVRAEAGESKREQERAAAAAPTVAPTETAAAANDLQADPKDATPNEESVDQDAFGEAKLDATKNEAKPAEGSGRGMTSLGDVPGGALGGAGGATPSQPATQTKSGGSAGPASGRWDIVVRGDRARQAGDCVAAREEYALALEDDEARVRARAFAGLGLCDAVAGDEASADANYERARGLDDEIGSYLESQNQRSRGADKKSRKPTKKSKAQVDAFDDPSDPFQ